MKSTKESDIFSFVIGGTAHFVLTSTERKWIPISMYALPPKMNVSIGVSEYDYLYRVKKKLQMNELIYESDTEIRFQKEGYIFSLVYYSGFNNQIPKLLNLPLA